MEYEEGKDKGKRKVRRIKWETDKGGEGQKVGGRETHCRGMDGDGIQGMNK